MVAVTTGNIDALKGMSDVEFDFGVSGALKTAFGAEADRLSGQRGSRASYRQTGITDFRGHFSQVFTANGQTQLGDLDEVVSALRLVVTEVAALEQAAREENDRRRVARQWAQRQADRNSVSRWIDDHITGSEDPPAVTPADSGPYRSVPQPAPTPRQTPPPGSGSGGGGGTSSARPSDLRSFATSSAAADTELSAGPTRLQGQCSDFAASCSWATLDASVPITGYRQWLSLNGDDERWATTDADSFRRAGSEATVSTLSNHTVEAALRAAHVSASRPDIEIDPPTAYGSPPTTGYANDPVNTAFGNFTEDENDLGFPGGAASLRWTRSYSSRNAAEGACGRGWSSWAEAGLRVDDEAARLRLPDGREVVFPRLGEGWDRAVGENMWLSRTGTEAGPGTHEVTTSTGVRWLLRGDGRLQQTSVGAGTRVDFAYDAAGRLAAMHHERGRS